MPRQHFIIQMRPQGQVDANGVEHQTGGCCGAVCLTYLIGEVIDRTDTAIEHDIFVNCREKTKIGDGLNAPTNPYQIQCYLRGNLYSDRVGELIGGRNFTVIPKIWENSENNNAINLAYGNEMRAYAEAVFPMEFGRISPTSPMAGQAFIMDDKSFFLGVFKDKYCGGNLPDSPADLHYILLKNEGGKIIFNNPHNNQWMDAGINSIYGNFTIEDGEWVWTNYGLYITVE